MTHIIYHHTFALQGLMCFGNCAQTLEDALKALKVDELPEDTTVLLDLTPEPSGCTQLHVALTSNKLHSLTDKTQMTVTARCERIVRECGFQILRQPIEAPLSFFSSATMLILAALFAAWLLVAFSWGSSVAILGLHASTTLCVTWLSWPYLVSCFKTQHIQSLSPMNALMSLNWLVTLVHLWIAPHLTTLSWMGIITQHGLPVVLLAAVRILHAWPAQILQTIHSIDVKTATAQPSSFTKQGVLTPKILLQQGDIINIPPHARLPADATLLSPWCVVDESLQTGHYRAFHEKGHCLYGGTINCDKTIQVRLVSTPFASRSNQLQLPAYRLHAHREQIPPLWHNTSLCLVGIICLGLMVAVWVAPTALTGGNALSWLLCLCPCTLTLVDALPNILLLRALHSKEIRLSRLATLNQPHTLILDKTGTLTHSEGRVQETTIHDTTLLSMICRLEQLTPSHPMAHTLLLHAKAQQITPSTHTITAPQISSQGLCAQLDGQELIIGNQAWLKQHGCVVGQPPCHSSATPVYVALNKQYQGYFLVDFPLRENIVEQLRALQAEGTRLYLLTGDNQATTSAFVKQLGDLFPTGTVFTDLTPERKQSTLEELIQATSGEPSGIWAVGDAMNDALMLKRVSERGGTACAIKARKDVCHLVDLTLDGGLSYLLRVQAISRYLNGIVLDNHLLFITLFGIQTAVFVTACSLGSPMPPFVAMLTMLVSGTGLLLNSQRIVLAIWSQYSTNHRAWDLPTTSQITFLCGLFSMCSLGLGFVLHSLRMGYLAAPAVLTSLSNWSICTMCASLGCAGLLFSSILCAVLTRALHLHEQSTSDPKHATKPTPSPQSHKISDPYPACTAWFSKLFRYSNNTPQPLQNPIPRPVRP